MDTATESQNSVPVAWLVAGVAGPGLLAVPAYEENLLGVGRFVRPDTRLGGSRPDSWRSKPTRWSQSCPERLGPEQVKTRSAARRSRSSWGAGAG